jgi:hyperosmotically inducible protein
MPNREIANKLILRALVATSLAGVFVVAGCNLMKKPNYPDSKAAVSSSLTQKDLGSIGVSQARDKGVITLSGTVPTPDEKQQAESVAKQAAPNYTIADEIAVVSPGSAVATKAGDSDTDGAIKDNFKAALTKNPNLDKQSISVKSTNGVVVLSGSVKTEADKLEAEKLAKAVPNVQQVVNEIDVKLPATGQSK